MNLYCALKAGGTKEIWLEWNLHAFLHGNKWIMASMVYYIFHEAHQQGVGLMHN